MKKFWTIVLGSFVGMWIAMLLFSIISFIASIAFMGAMASFGSKTPTEITENSVLKIDLDCNITEQTPEDDFGLGSVIMGDNTESIGIDVLLHSIEVAKNDDRIKGIYLECNGVSAGTAVLYELRDALENFYSESGKFIYAYGDNYTQGDYYLASVADSLYINTIGSISLHGLSSTVTFYKGALDKLGVEMEIVRVGTFKSAVEPFMLTEMSEANRLQYSTFLNSVWGTIVDGIARGRNITREQVNLAADSIGWLQPTDYFIKNGFADEALYKDAFMRRLKNAAGVALTDDINFLSPSDLENEMPRESNSSDQIAVVYAVGEIGVEDGIVGEKLSKIILDLADDDDVKGLVLRVNSPGGSAYDSEQIWHALEQVKAAGKPLAVSMSDLAASGGYYISCGGDRIFAEPTTLTGSIGVFGFLPVVGDLFEDKLGITFSTVQTNANSSFPSGLERMTPAQRNAMQRNVNETYELFVGRCAAGRNMPADSIKAIAEGRIWDGKTALSLNLVDELGNLEDAISWVAARAEIEDYSIVIAPEQEDFFTRLMSKYSTSVYEKKMQQEMGPLYKHHRELKRIMERDRILCIAPETVSID